MIFSELFTMALKYLNVNCSPLSYNYLPKTLTHFSEIRCRSRRKNYNFSLPFLWENSHFQDLNVNFTLSPSHSGTKIPPRLSQQRGAIQINKTQFLPIFLSLCCSIKLFGKIPPIVARFIKLRFGGLSFRQSP